MSSIPLLWQAAQAGAINIISYLASDRPQAAYRFYSFTSSDERALLLRRHTDMERSLAEWLGWTISPLNESPLTAAVLENKLRCIEALFAESRDLMHSALHLR
jgi:hypothetical protein